MRPRAFLLAFVLPLFYSCSGSPPAIDAVEWRVLLRDDGSDRFEELAVFARLSDPDGAPDLAQLSVTAGETGLVWRFPRNDWISTTNGDEWWGFPAIVPLEGSRLPDGLYTVRLEDLSGTASETTFRLDADRPHPETAAWPEVELVNGKLVMSGVDTTAIMMTRDAEDRLMESLPVGNGSPVQTEDIDTWEIWIPWEAESSGFRLGPYSTLTAETE